MPESINIERSNWCHLVTNRPSYGLNLLALGFTCHLLGGTSMWTPIGHDLNILDHLLLGNKCGSQVSVCTSGVLSGFHRCFNPCLWMVASVFLHLRSFLKYGGLCYVFMWSWVCRLFSVCKDLNAHSFECNSTYCMCVSVCVIGLWYALERTD